MNITPDNNEITLQAVDMRTLVEQGFVQAGTVKIIFQPPALTTAFSLELHDAFADNNAPPHEDPDVIQTVETTYTISTIYRQGKGSLRSLADVSAQSRALQPDKLKLLARIVTDSWGRGFAQCV